ncbi:MAG: hypothetical protein EBQ89_02290 [Alphaproteobacteria bacterium]|nr:hypothetical protein [Alphaproteobacteria bacterium]
MDFDILLEIQGQLENMGSLDDRAKNLLAQAHQNAYTRLNDYLQSDGFLKSNQTVASIEDHAATLFAHDQWRKILLGQSHEGVIDQWGLQAHMIYAKRLAEKYYHSNREDLILAANTKAALEKRWSVCAAELASKVLGEGLSRRLGLDLWTNAKRELADRVDMMSNRLNVFQLMYTSFIARHGLENK